MFLEDVFLMEFFIMEERDVQIFLVEGLINVDHGHIFFVFERKKQKSFIFIIF